MLIVVYDFEILRYFSASDYMDGSSNFDNTQCAEMCFFFGQTYFNDCTNLLSTYYFFKYTYNFTNYNIFSKFVTLALALWF